MLAQLIRFYGGTIQGVFARYLEESFNLFASQQEAQAGIPKDPVEAFNALTRKNLEMWNDMQDTFMQASGFKKKEKPDKS